MMISGKIPARRRLRARLHRRRRRLSSAMKGMVYFGTGFRRISPGFSIGASAMTYRREEVNRPRVTVNPSHHDGPRSVSGQVAASGVLSFHPGAIRNRDCRPKTRRHFVFSRLLRAAASFFNWSLPTSGWTRSSEERTPKFGAAAWNLIRSLPAEQNPTSWPSWVSRRSRGWPASVPG